MESVLTSIQAKWCEKIFDGSKTIELRKTAPKETPFKAYVYCTTRRAGEWELFLDHYGGRPKAGWVSPVNHATALHMGMQPLNGFVIGEFVCDRIERFDVPFPAYMDQVDTQLLKAACLSYREAHAYLGHRSGKGWHIINPKLYDEPRPLTNYHRPCPEGLYCESCAMHNEHPVPHCGNYALEIRRPPQSWMYAEDQT